MDPIVLRLPRVGGPDDEPEFVLLNVSSAGHNPLDIKLIGTQNENVFTVSLKHNQTSELQEKKSKLNQDQWQNILSMVLLGAAGDGDDAAEGLEAFAKIEDGPSMVITIRRSVEGITQKLGQITLPEQEEEEADLYDWCGLTIRANNILGQELKTTKTSLTQKDEQIKKLEDSLAELVKLKTENDTQLFEKFSLLLNEKKLKIRDQQRILQCSNVDPAKLEAIQETRSTRAASVSRKGKRKARDTEDIDNSSDEGFEKMEVDDQANGSDQEQPQTPDDSTADEATADEDSDEEPPVPATKKGTNTKKGEVIDDEKPSSSSGTLADEPLPPPRVLPFARKPPAKSQPPKSELKMTDPADGSETESDDEL